MAKSDFMTTQLVEHFNNACDMAKKISELPNLTPEQYEEIFAHVSNSDMMVTIRTIQHAYYNVQKAHLLGD